MKNIDNVKTAKKAMETFNELSKNGSNNSKTIAHLFYKIKEENLYIETSFSKFIDAHNVEFKDFSKSTIYNYIACYKYVLVHSWSDKLSFTQCYELVKPCKNGYDGIILENIEDIINMSIKELKTWIKENELNKKDGNNENNDNNENENNSNQLENENTNIIDALMLISEFINKYPNDENYAKTIEALGKISEKLDA